MTIYIDVEILRLGRMFVLNAGILNGILRNEFRWNLIIIRILQVIVQIIKFWGIKKFRLMTARWFENV